MKEIKDVLFAAVDNADYVYVISTDEGESIAEDSKGFILVFDTIKQIADWAVTNDIPFEKIIVDKVKVLGVGENDDA